MTHTIPLTCLQDVAILNPSLDNNPELDEIVSFLPMSSVDADLIDAVDIDSRRYEEVSKGYTPFITDDVLVAKITPCFENGKIVQAKPTHRVGFGSTEFHIVRPIKNKLDSRYLVHFLRQEYIREEGRRKMTGSAGQRRLPAYYLANLKIPLPSLSEQQRIAEILDKADALQAKRRAALALLDMLTQSIFLEMFGDPSVNCKGWDCIPLGDVAIKFSDGPFGSNLKTEHYKEDGIRVIRLQNIGVGEFLNDDKAFVSENHFLSLSKHECHPGDIIIGTLGDPNLRACIQPDWLKRAINKADCVQLRPNETIVNAVYLCNLLNLPSVERMAHALVLGQTRLRISMGRLRGLIVPIPPIQLQMKFAQRANDINDLKTMLNHSLIELDTLFSSLQHRAFRGEL